MTEDTKKMEAAEVAKALVVNSGGTTRRRTRRGGGNIDNSDENMK